MNKIDDIKTLIDKLIIFYDMGDHVQFDLCFDELKKSIAECKADGTLSDSSIQKIEENIKRVENELTQINMS